MKLLPLSLLVLVIAGGIGPAAVAGQRVMVMEGQKARPDPVVPLLNKERAIGICYAIDYNWSGKGSSMLSPNAVASEYFWRFENKTIDEPSITSAELVTPPMHGKVVYFLEKDGLSYPRYIPDLNYVGDDKITFKVNVDGTSVKVVMLIKVTDKGADTEGLQESICKKTGAFWKISQDPDGHPILTAIGNPSLAVAPTGVFGVRSNIPTSPFPATIFQCPGH